jgi:uncharacterized membrane protein
MQVDEIQILIATYPTNQSAEHALRSLQLAKKDQSVEVIDAAVVSRDEHQKLRIHETVDVTGGRGAAVGGVLGGVLGIIAGPGGIVVGAAVGALVGGAAASVFDTGIPHKRLTEIGNTLTPGTAALVVLAEQGFGDFITAVVKGGSLELHGESMNAESAAKLGRDHDVAVKSLKMGDALSAGGMASAAEEPAPPET